MFIRFRRAKSLAEWSDIRDENRRRRALPAARKFSRKAVRIPKWSVIERERVEKRLRQNDEKVIY